MADIRRNLGDGVDPHWLPSEGYLTRFCNRWNITSQCRTNKKKLSIEERLPAIQAFHQYWVYGVQHRQPPRDPKYGRYTPGTIYAMDQVPMAFSSPNNRTLNDKGERCRLLGIVEDDKRFCTLNVTLCADPDNQDVKVEVVFRGLGPENGGRVSQEEMNFYSAHPIVQVRWQNKAWADHRVCLDYLLDFRTQTLSKGHVALFMDNHGSQQTPLMRVLMHALDVEYVFTPANCTDAVSPVDRNVGQALKEKVYAMQEEELDLDGNEHWRYPASEGGLEAWEKRTMVVAWIDRAWQELKKDNKHLLLSSFVDTGILVANDGSENHLIRLHPKQVLGAYTF